MGKNKVIIERFGCHPHRNQTLERESTAEEIEFLKQLNSSFESFIDLLVLLMLI